MNNPLYYTPEEAEQTLRRFGDRVPTAEAIRTQAQKNRESLGYPVSVIGSRVYIPRHSFDTFWGIPEKKGGEVNA